MEEDFQMRVALLEAGEDFGEEVGSHHGGDADLDGALLELLVVVDLQHSILDVPQGQFDAVEEDCSLRGQGQLFLAPVKKLDAKLCFQLFDSDRDVGLGDAQPFRSPGDIPQTAGHLEIFELSEFHAIASFFVDINLLYLLFIISYFTHINDIIIKNYCCSVKNFFPLLW